MEKQVRWNSVNSTSDTSITQTKSHGPCLGNDNLLGISWTFSHNSNWKLRLVSSNYLLSGWMRLHSCFLFTWEENLANFRKFSQHMEYTRAKWTRYSGHMVKAKGEHNSQLWLKQRESITHNSNFLAVSCSSSYPSFTVPGSASLL